MLHSSNFISIKIKGNNDDGDDNEDDDDDEDDEYDDDDLLRYLDAMVCLT